MYSHWPTAARAAIERAVADLPADADLKARQKALRAAAGGFHCGTSHGKKVWAKEARLYLQRHGLPPRTLPDQPRFADDIVFPWKGESQS